MRKTHSSVRSILLLFVFSLVFISFSCKKYFEEKPRQNLSTPSTLSDLQAILNNEVINGGSPGDLEFVADNYYLTDLAWNSPVVSVEERKSYIWDRDARTTTPQVWNEAYNAVYLANFVLDQLPGVKVGSDEKTVYNSIEGSALFIRSFLFHQLAQLFCKPYSPGGNNTDPGIVLRLKPEVNSPSTRSTIQQTYDQITSDLKTAVTLLPVKSIVATRPNKVAAFGELARVYLSMGMYEEAGKYADSCLQLSSGLLNYDSLVSLGSSFLPSHVQNPEVLFISYERTAPNHLLSNHLMLIDSFLLRSYSMSDLRRKFFFGTDTGFEPFYWQGAYFNYGSITRIFDGLATDEIYLIRSECNARALTSASVDKAMADLNKLLRHRYKANQFIDIIPIDPVDALDIILRERRKELLFRGLRWSDLRRLNLEGYDITLKRVINGMPYELRPGDLRWVLLIPDVEIRLSGIPQNPR